MPKSRLIVALLVAAALPTTLAPGAGAAQRGWYPFAPYVDFSGYPPPKLASIGSGSGARHITLGFVTARAGAKCAPTWGGYATYPAAGARPYRLADVRALRRAGGDVVPSFGGAAGTELALACRSVPELAAAYGAVIGAYRATHVDFDIEGSSEANAAANTRRALAIAQLQRAARAKGRALRVSYTVPVLPNGLDSVGRAVIRNAASHGVSLSVVNIMTMDYGDSAAPNPAGRMGVFAIQAAQALQRQLHRIYPRLGQAALWHRVGITPMLGINDVAAEVFGLADARQLAAFATREHVGMLSMWELARDRQCQQPRRDTQIDCSGVSQAPWDFARALGTFSS